MPTEEEAAVRFDPTLDHSQRGGSTTAPRASAHGPISQEDTNNCARPPRTARAIFEPAQPFLQIALQKIQRGNSARALAADVKDETARQQWVDYYLQIGDEAQARDLGWRPEGEAAAVTMADEPPGAPPAAAPAADAAGGDGGKEAAAAAAIQAAMRGKVVRAEFQDFKDETARQQWMAYYLELGEYDAAKEYGWEPPPGWTPPAAGEAPAATSSEGAAAPVVPPLKFGEAEAGQLAITNEGGELAESEIPIFSARWFGQVFAAFTPRGETEEEETKRKEEKAAILVQAFARTLLARIAVKDESRKCARAPPSARYPQRRPSRTAARRRRLPPPLPVGPAAQPPSPPRPPSGTVCSLCTRTSRRSTRRRSRRSSASPAAARTRRWPS